MRTMKKTRGQKAAAIRAILEKTPGRAPALVVEDMKKLGFPNTKAQNVYQERLRMKRKVAKAEALPKTEQKEHHQVEPLLIQVRIPATGAVLKVNNKQGMIGTLLINEKGVIFAKANAKKADMPRMSWDMLDRLGQSGLIKE
jgi:hypothetical protein